jgi:simple sugar transport system ATP-binding protein
VDVRGIGFIHELIRTARDEGAAVVLFSEELDELRELSDRIVVLHRGRIVGELPGESTRAEIGALMLGHSGEEHVA